MDRPGFDRLAAVMLLALAAAGSAHCLPAALAQTANEKEANGPIPDDVSLYASELACTQKLPTPGYYPSPNGAEIADAARSGLFPCVTFTGSDTGRNRV